MDTTHDTSFNNPHDRSNITSITDYGIRRSQYGDPTHSIISMPSVRVVEVDSSKQMFPSHPTASLITSLVFTFVCCFACSVPAIIYSKHAVDYAAEGNKRLAASLANIIAFWLILSCLGGILWWASVIIFTHAYRFQ